MVNRNLLIILAHGLRSDAISDSATWPLSTPNMQKLAGRGLRLVASSACPSDWGGMASVWTGLHARQHGLLEPGLPMSGVEGWAASLAAGGYHLAGVGCVGSIVDHLHDAVLVEPPQVIASDFCQYLRAMASKGLLGAVQDQRRQRLRGGPFEPDRLLLEPDDDVDGFIIVEARKMVGRLPVDKPWALVVVLSGPGNELPPPNMYNAVVEPELVEKGFIPADLRQVDVLAELDYPRVMLQRLEPHQLARIRMDYLGRVCLLDFGVGRLTRAVEHRPDKDRTWVVLSSDRGQLLGEHGLVGHRSFLCPALEVPVMIAPPGHHRQMEYETGMISTVDLAATITELGGCDLPSGCAGQSLLPMLSGYRQGSTGTQGQANSGLENELPRLSPPRASEGNTNSEGDSGDIPGGTHTYKVWASGGGACLSEFGQRVLLETDRFKVVFDVQSREAIGLYDLLNDPSESQNLVGSAKGLNWLDSLRWRLGDLLLPLRVSGR